MPRPGPRPYECVRRAWHSDRHQPIRGSLIQEIFRVVNETHSSATKKNKEWQEKLPIVVLKAEEIMYSKANSEAEYMDLKTLWDRTNDAINTIIRSDETTESGNFLQPCIEAALNLGCMPRRASRSQRNSFPGCYLSSSSQGPTNVSPSAVDNSAQRNLRASSECIVNRSNLGKSGTISATYSGAKLASPIVENGNRTANKFPLSCERFTPATNSVCFLGEAICPSSKCSVYPLYQGDRLESEAPNPKYGFGLGAKSSSFKMEPVATDSIQNGLSSVVDASNKRVDCAKDPTESACDLALRLGPISIPCSSVETGGPLEVEEGGFTSSRERSKLTDLSIQIFRKCNTDDPTDSGSSKVTAEDELSNGYATTRKRKAVCGNCMEDQPFFWQSKLPHVGRMEKTGL